MTIDNDDNFDKLEREKFDVAVVDSLYFSKCVYLIPHRLQIPYITFTIAVDPLEIRVSWLPSFVPTLVFPLSEQMNFLERLENTVGLLAVSYTHLTLPTNREV